MNVSTFNISSLLYLNLKYVHLIRSFQKNIPAYGRPQNISICEDSSIDISRLVCQDRNLSLGGQAYLPGLAKPPYLLKQLCDLKILQDLECPKAMLYSQFNACLHYLLQLWPQTSPKGGNGKNTKAHTDIATYRLNLPRGPIQ